MLRVAICDDMKDQVRLIHQAAMNYFQRENQQVSYKLYDNAFAFMDDIEAKTPFDIILLDICMPGLLGTDIARELRQERGKSEIIFLTSSDEYAIDAFSVDAAHYLLKPFTQDQFDQAMKRAIDRIRLRNSKRIVFKVEGGIRVEELDNILYAESNGHILTVFLRDGQFTTRQTLTSLQEKLETISPGQFTVPSKGYLVNRKAIRAIKTNAVEVGDALIPLSRGTNRKFQEEYFEYIFSM